MKQTIEMEECMIKAFGTIENFIAQSSGIKPEPEEIAAALSKYFVLKEILGFIEMARQDKR